MKQKKIMILGGGSNQIPLFQSAKELGYAVVLCDSKEDVLCKKFSDEFYRIDISNPDYVTQAARLCRVNGVLSNTESLMTCLAAVQNDLGVVSNPIEAIEKIVNKHEFRILERRVGVFSPKSFVVTSYEEVKKAYSEFNGKVILKPEKSSGSRGTFIINDESELTEVVFLDCVRWSRDNTALIESLIDLQNCSGIEAEMFLIDGEIEFLFMFRTIRDKIYNTIPQCYCSDTELTYSEKERIKLVLNKLVKAAGLRWGEFNVELFFTPENDVFVIEINARQGGMRLPEFVKLFSKIDVNKLLVSTCVGDLDYFHSISKDTLSQDENVIHFRLLTDKKGTLKNVRIDEVVLKYLKGSFFYYDIDSDVLPAYHTMSSIGVFDFLFPNQTVRKNAEEDLFKMVTATIE